MQSANEQMGQLLIDFNIIIKQLKKIKEPHLPKPVLLRHVWPDIGIFTQPATIIISLACPPPARARLRDTGQCMPKRSLPQLLKAIVIQELFRELLRRTDWSSNGHCTFT